VAGVIGVLALRSAKPKPVPQTLLEVPYPHEQAGRRH
jgi:hypothetical protein